AVTATTRAAPKHARARPAVRAAPSRWKNSTIWSRSTSSSVCCSPGVLSNFCRVLDRRTERAERRKLHITELRKRAAEADAKLRRLYDAIENSVADLSDPMRKDRIGELKATPDQARLDAERAEDAIERGGPFARTARKRMRTDGGGYRRDHLRAFAQRVEVDQKELRIMERKARFCARASRLQAQNGWFWRAQFCG